MIIQNSPSPMVPTASSVPSAPAGAVATVRTPTVEVTVAAEAAQPNVPEESISRVVADVNAALRRSGSALQFTIDRDTETAVVTMVDADTGEVIRQIPSDEALAIARSIDAMLARSGTSCESGILCQQIA